MSVTGAIVAGVGAAGAIGGAALSSNAAGNAASTQAGAADKAAQLQYQAEQNALQFQEQTWNQQQSDIAPWLQSGAGALSTMDQLMGLNAPNIPANYGQPIANNGTAPNPFPGQTPAGAPPAGAAPPSGPGSPATPPMKGGNYVNIGNRAQFNTGPSPTGPNGITTAGGPGGPPIAGWGVQGGQPPAAGPGFAGSPPAVNGTAMPGKGNLQQPAGAAAGTPTGAPTGAAPGIASGQLQPFAPWTQQFQAPTADQARQTPGYQFQLDQGTQAVQNSAAARGDLLSGNTLSALTNFGQGLADTTYNDTYNRALGQYQQNYNIYENNQANQFNRLASMAGMGQTAVGQLNSAGSNASSNFGNTLIGSTNAIGNNMNNAAAATASGYVGSANAYGGALGSLGSLGSMIPYLSMMNGGQSSTGLPPGQYTNAGDPTLG